jgi:coproporphyrinogen III oxidase
MKEIKNDIIKKYQYEDYVIYIKDVKSYYDVFLQNEKNGIIGLLFGVFKSDIKDIKDLEKIIESNMDDYMIYYVEHYEN